MKITIIGAAGTLGSCAAFNLIVHKLADEIVMIDPWENMLKAHWMDLSTAATVMDVIVHSGKYEDMKGSDIVINTAGAPSGVISSRLELLTKNLPVVKENTEKINQYCPDAIVITATNPVNPLNYAVYLLSKNRDRRKYLGYSLNDTIRFRMWSAQALGVKSSHVQGMVIGEHGHSQVMLFSTPRVDGKQVKFDEQTKQKIRAEIPKTLHGYETLIPKRTAGWTSAIGIVATVRAITNNSKEVIPTDAVLAGEYNCDNLSMTVPAVIGRRGIVGIKELDLAADEQEGLKHTVEALSPHMRYIEETLGIKAKIFYSKGELL